MDERDDMVMTEQQPDTCDRIQPRSHVATEKIEVKSPWMTIKADEQTVPQGGSVDSDQPTCAELIRLMSSSFDERRRS